jgi:hypothetical protein
VRIAARHGAGVCVGCRTQASIDVLTPEAASLEFVVEGVARRAESLDGRRRAAQTLAKSLDDQGLFEGGPLLGQALADGIGVGAVQIDAEAVIGAE